MERGWEEEAGARLECSSASRLQQLGLEAKQESEQKPAQLPCPPSHVEMLHTGLVNVHQQLLNGSCCLLHAQGQALSPEASLLSVLHTSALTALLMCPYLQELFEALFP